MGALINFSVNLDSLDKSKVVKGKKGNYYNLTLSINDETSQYGDNASIFDSQTIEERDTKVARNYVGNGKVVWTDGLISVAEKKQQEETVEEDVDFPF